MFDLSKQTWLKAEHFGEQPDTFARPELVRIPFIQEELNYQGLVTYLIWDPAKGEFKFMTTIIDLANQIVQVLWTDVQGLTEYFRDSTGGELRLELSLFNLE